ncbi:hypothetical protein [Mycolicibacterium mucogenicum]|uniref:hypothetical protein n=1 Tax=Mycolicibacterium mucogenicum TaxID=56689 RepID=UPI002269E57B|nr:hypothetical protein [Mycolicibacterium mucogenicum]
MAGSTIGGINQKEGTQMPETDIWENDQSGGTWFNRWVTLHDDGSMSIEGQDLGDAPLNAFGGREYEFSRAVSPSGVMRFRELLDCAPSEPLLPALRSRFTSTGQIEEALQEAGIDSEFWSRVGDRPSER